MMKHAACLLPSERVGAPRDSLGLSLVMVGKKEVLSSQEIRPLAAGITEEPSRVKIDNSERLNVINNFRGCYCSLLSCVKFSWSTLTTKMF